MSERKLIGANGIPIYSYTNEHSHGFFISLFVKSGSMYERAEENGITHFLEHVAIRNVNHLMGGELYSVLDEHGLEFNASTYSEMVQFYTAGASESFKRASEIISMILSPITLPVSEVELERGRIRAEIREADDRSSLAGFTAERVWSGTSLARQITGTAKTVGAITRKRLEEYRRTVFNPGNLFFYVTGNVSCEELSEFAESLARYELPAGVAHDNVAPVPTDFGKRGGAIAIKNADFTKVRFTFDIDMSRVSMQEIDLLYEIVLGGYNSDFFIELSEKRGLFYDLSGATERYCNIGSFSFSYELREAKLYDAVSMTVELLAQLKSRVLPERKCMKAGYVENARMLLDDAREMNFTFGYDNHVMQLGYTDIDDRIEKYRSITPERLLEVAREVFRYDNLTLTVKGREKKIDKTRLKAILSTL